MRRQTRDYDANAADAAGTDRRSVLKAVGASTVGFSALADAAVAQDDVPPVLHVELSLRDGLFLGREDLPSAEEIDYSPDEDLDGELGAEIADVVGEITGAEIAVSKSFCFRGPPDYDEFDRVEGLLVESLTPPEPVRENPEESWEELLDAGTPRAIDETFVRAVREEPEIVGPRTSFLTDRVPDEFTVFDDETVEEVVPAVTEVTGIEFHPDRIGAGYVSQIDDLQGLLDDVCEVIPWAPWCNDGPSDEQRCLNLCRSVCPSGWWARVSGLEDLCYNTCDSLCEGACRLLSIMADKFGLGGEIIDEIRELVCG